MQWKAHFYNERKHNKENETQTIPKTYALKSLNCLPQVKELIQFESDLLDLIKSFSKETERRHKHYP